MEEDIGNSNEVSYGAYLKGFTRLHGLSGLISVCL